MKPIILIRPFAYALLLGCLLGAGWSSAESPNESPQWDVRIGIGAGLRTNPVLQNDDIPLVIVPQISYQNNRFFVQNLDMGYTLVTTDTQQLNLVVMPTDEQFFFYPHSSFNVFSVDSFANKLNGGEEVLTSDGGSTNTLTGPTNKRMLTIDSASLHKRRMGALAGIEYDYTWQDYDVLVQALQETTHYYDGSELRLALSKTFSRNHYNVKVTLGAHWQSKETNTYFYGLSAQESDDVLTYTATSGTSGLLRGEWNYQLDAHWTLRFLASYRVLSRAITDSPLITSDHVVTAFAGGVYHF